MASSSVGLKNKLLDRKPEVLDRWGSRPDDGP